MNLAKKLDQRIGNELSAEKAPRSYFNLVGLFPLQLITTKTQYSTAIKVIENLMILVGNENAIDEGCKTYLTTLAELVSEYEKKTTKPNGATGEEALLYLMELKNLTQKDLAKEIGSQGVVSKILNGERKLNLRQIKALAKKFKVSAEVFI